MALKPTGVLMRGVVHNELGTDSKHAISQKIVTDELNKKVPTARKINGKALTADVTLAAGDVGAYAKSETYTKAEVDSKVGAVVPKTAVVQATGTSTTNIMSQKSVTDQLATKVPTSRKVNGKVLSADVTLVAGDVGAYTKAEVDTKVNGATGSALQKSALAATVGTSTTTAMTQKATTDQLNTKVPTARKVNGKPLTGDVTLAPGDVGAYAKSETYTKAETDGKISTAIDAQPKLLSGASAPDASLGKVGDWYIQY